MTARSSSLSTRSSASWRRAVPKLTHLFTSLSGIKIGPGAFAKGIFLKLKEGAKGDAAGEEYQQVRPLEEQEPLESRRVWGKVIEAIHAKDFGRATKEKQIVEQRQRDEAAERKKKGEEYVPRFFDKAYEDGRPTLTAAGREVVEGLLKGGPTASTSA